MSKKKPAQFTPYFTESDADQVRAAFLAAGAAEGYGPARSAQTAVQIQSGQKMGTGPGRRPAPRADGHSKKR